MANDLASALFDVGLHNILCVSSIRKYFSTLCAHAAAVMRGLMVFHLALICCLNTVCEMQNYEGEKICTYHFE